jgi:hypothetical protein
VSRSTQDLAALLDQLEDAVGAPDAVPSRDGWELVLAENIAYLAGDQRRWEALAELRRVVGLAPERILAAPQEVLLGIVAGARPAERVERLRRCAELMVRLRRPPACGCPPRFLRCNGPTSYCVGTGRNSAGAATQPARRARSPLAARAPGTPNRFTERSAAGPVGLAGRVSRSLLGQLREPGVAE